MITEKIKIVFPKLRKSEQRVAKYILENSYEIENISLDKLAKRADVSQPTVLRMLKACGYNGHKEAKLALIEERLQREGGQIYDGFGIEFEKNNRIEDVPGKVIQHTMKILEDSLQAVSAKELKKAVRAIEGARKVCIFSVENSNSVAMDLMIKLLYLGIECEFNEDYYLQSIRAGHMKEGETAIGISYTGTSKNTVDVLKQAKKCGATTIAITNFSDTPLEKYADIVILTSNKQFLYGKDIFSRTVHLAVVDMIYMGLIIENYDKYESRLKESGKMIKNRKYE